MLESYGPRCYGCLMLQMKEMNASKENTEPNSCMPDDQHVHYTTIEMESSNTSQARKNSKEKISTRDISLLSGTLGLRSMSNKSLVWIYTSEICKFIHSSAEKPNDNTSSRRIECHIEYVRWTELAGYVPQM